MAWTAEQRREYSRAYYAANREKEIARVKAWREDNIEQSRESNRIANRNYLKKLGSDRSMMAQMLLRKTQQGSFQRGHDHDLDVEYIQFLLSKQKYLCALSGIELDHNCGDAGNLRLASVDRIDSKKGYIKGNVQIVINALNKAKGTATNREFRKLLAEIKKVG